MSSRSSSRSRETGPPKTLAEFVALVRECLGAHRYLALATSFAVVALGAMSVWNSFQSPDLMTDDDKEDELAQLGLFDELPIDQGESDGHTNRAQAVTVPTPHRGPLEDLSPLFRPESIHGSGVITATFEGTSLSTPALPVWLAGTIETDDEPVPRLQPDFAREPVQQATGPILVPQ